MNRLRGARSWVMVAALLLLPSLALAEISVQLDGRGNYRRTWFLTAARGRSPVIWEQVRPHLPPSVLLNPLGDTYGDRMPVIKFSPLTGYPWVVWPKNFGNIRQLAFSTWDGRKWTEPSLVIPGVPLVYDDQDPALAIDPAGTEFLVWSRAEQTAKIYLSLLIQGRWAPAMLVSDASVDSRAPSIVLSGAVALITYRTPAGPVTKSYQTLRLVESAASLMDNPIPPLYSPPVAPPGADPTTGGGGGGGGARKE